MGSLTNNIILLTDSYKVSHWKQYPPGTKNVYSYFESRGGMFPYTVFFGLQAIIKQYLEGGIVSESDIEEAEYLFKGHFGRENLFNKFAWQQLVKRHYGFLPVSIKAVPEGSIIPVSNVLMTIEATDPEFYWLVNYLETLLVQCWYPITVATQSHWIKGIINKYLQETGSEHPDFKLHDFGFRGVSSVHGAATGGAAHLINFKGTDTVIALEYINRFYYGDGAAGYSIPASEHSTICSWGKDREYAAMSNMLMQYPTGLVACVSDSYDIYNACRQIWGTDLKGQLVQRNGTLVIRPDSGELPDTLIKIFEILDERFGMKKNDKGYKVLPHYLRVIQGDGVNKDSIEMILAAMKEKGYSADNIAFGMGGALLQKLDRDTQKFAFKCSSINVDGEERDVYKSPIGDLGKLSKRGRLKLCHDSNGFYTCRDNENPGKRDELVEVFRDGVLLKQYTFEEIRKRVIQQS